MSISSPTHGWCDEKKMEGKLGFANGGEVRIYNWYVRFKLKYIERVKIL
jgi:hypothetical protein